MNIEKKMATGYDKNRIRNNMNKIARIPIIKKRETPAFHNAYELNET